MHVCTRAYAYVATRRTDREDRARTVSEYSPLRYLVTNTARPNHRPYLHPRRSVAESAAIFYTRQHILHCDVGRSATRCKAQAARASAVSADVPWRGIVVTRASSVLVSENGRSAARERARRSAREGRLRFVSRNSCARSVVPLFDLVARSQWETTNGLASR